MRSYEQLSRRLPRRDSCGREAFFWDCFALRWGRGSSAAGLAQWACFGSPAPIQTTILCWDSDGPAQGHLYIAAKSPSFRQLAPVSAFALAGSARNFFRQVGACPYETICRGEAQWFINYNMYFRRPAKESVTPRTRLSMTVKETQLRDPCHAVEQGGLHEAGSPSALAPGFQ